MSKPVLDNLFGSKIRVKVLKFLYRNFPADFSVREIAQRIQESYPDARQEVETLRQMFIIKRIKKSSPRRERFTLNPDFEYFSELRRLILKSSAGEKERMLKRVSALGRVRLAVISGIFLSDPDTVSQYDSPSDLFIVGDDINRAKLRNFLAAIEAEIGTEIKFTLMDKEEFDYRYNMFDRFVRVLLEGPHEKIINKIGL